MNAGAANDWFRRGLTCLRERRFDAAAESLGRAAAQRHAGAQYLLGTLHLSGAGCAFDPARAAELFSAAAAGGSALAHCALANLALAGIGCPRDDALARRGLLAAARANCPPAWRALAFILDRTQAPQREPPAERCLAHAAALGDVVAQYLLGLRLASQPARHAEAAAWLARAAAQGVSRAASQLARLALTAAATPPDQAAAENPPDFDWPDFPRPVAQALSSQPAVGYCEGVLSASECEYLICLAEPQLRPSETLNPVTGEGIASSLRTSYSTNFHPVATDVVLELIRRALAAVAGLPVAHAEPLAILRYQPGQEYKPHYDYFTDEALAREPRLGASGQRVVTTFAYLSDVEQGGGTGFPRLDFSIEPRRGRVVRMENCDTSGRPDPRTLHAGLPVVAGEKWLATLWFRAQPFALA